MAQSASNLSLTASVSSLRSSLSLLDSSITILDAGIIDFPRLQNVLSSTRHFELIPQPTLVAAQASLHSELGPAITSLLERVQSHVARLERREQALIAKSELQEGRLSQSSGNRSDAERLGRKKSLDALLRGGGLEGANKEKAEKLRQLQMKKERLAFAVERLTLQSQQRQRQLRMSIAAT